MNSKKFIIIDYGMGNVASVKNAFKFLDIECKIEKNPDIISKADVLILPGVGSYKKAMKNIKSNFLDEAIKETIKKGNFIFGICLGMQLLGDSSTEDGYTKGLGYIDNKVDKFNKTETKNLKIPHIGFNEIKFDSKNKLFKGLKNNSDFYFVHSFKMKVDELKNNISITKYGISFLSSFHRDNIFGTQFHPEKSQGNGLKLLQNFISLI